MKAGPILFNTDMVKATLSGQKTQTRREVNGVGDDNWLKGASNHVVHAIDKCPFGQPGDLLYVRETWQGYRQVSYEYDEWESMDSPKDRHEQPYTPVYRADEKSFPEKWFPAIHMPREFSRLTLEITDVRVERLQDISNDDALAEGIGIPFDQRYAAIDAFRPLWNYIYGNWDTNPWVWVVEFKAHHCNVDAMLNERLAA